MEFITPPQSVSDSLPLATGLAIILIVVCILAVAVLSPRLKRQISRRGFSSMSTRKLRPSTESMWLNPSDPLSQLDIVRRNEYEKVRILNREEAKVLPLLERTLRDLGQGHRVMAQTSLGEVIRPKSSCLDGRNAMAAINSKRLDFAVIDKFGMLTCAVEYQGSGHHQNGAFIRDAVKREALRKAGVPLLEVLQDFQPEALAQSLRNTLTR